MRERDGGRKGGEREGGGREGEECSREAAFRNVTR